MRRRQHGSRPGKTLAHNATAIQTAVSSGLTATVCVRITDYVALAKAQTGTKLSTEQANPLTTEATNLADGLGC